MVQISQSYILLCGLVMIIQFMFSQRVGFSGTKGFSFLILALKKYMNVHLVMHATPVVATPPWKDLLASKNVFKEKKRTEN